MKVLKSLSKKALVIVCTLFLMWVLISFVDTNLHNGIDGSGLSSWNLFQILVDLSVSG